MIPCIRFHRSLVLPIFVCSLALWIQGCDESTSSNPSETGNTPAKSDTLSSIDLTSGGTFAKAGGTYYIRGGVIAGDLVFGRKVDVIVLAAPTVTGTLTFQEGCNVRFMEGTYLNITEGRLNVLGSDSLPVVLKNRTPGKFWGYGTSSTNSGGIWFSSSANSLSKIQYAQIDSATSGIYAEVDDIEIVHSSFSHSKYYGVVFNGDDHGPKAGFSYNTFSANKVGPFYLPASQLTRLDGTQSFASGEPNIGVDAATVKESGTWPALSVAYEMLGAVKIANPAGVVIGIAAGAHIVYDQSAFLEIGTAGTLKVNGTATKPVLMGPGQIGKRWGYGTSDYYSGGIWIGSDASPNTTINHLRLDSANTGIYVDVNGISIDSSTFTNSQYQAIHFDGNTSPGSLKGNTFANSGEYAFRVGFEALTALDGSGTFTGAKSNIKVMGSTAKNSGIIPAFPVSYVMFEKAMLSNPSGVSVEIQAGAHFLFQPSAYLYVGTAATLKVRGTSTKPVVMGPAQTGGTWGYGTSDYYSGGIWIGSDASSNSSINHLQLDFANTGIFVDVDGIKIDSSSFSNNKYEGINFYEGTIPGSLKNNIFANNGEYSIRVGFNGLPSLDGTGTFTGAHPDVYVQGKKIEASGTIPKLPVAYVIDGAAALGNASNAVTVTIAPGSLFKFIKNSYINVEDNGALVAVGTPSEPIVMENAVTGTTWGYGTSLSYCGGIWLGTGSSNQTRIGNATFKGVVNDIAIYNGQGSALSLTPVTVLPGI